MNCHQARHNGVIPTNTPRGFHVETRWKRPFPRRFNVESTWCVCREAMGYDHAIANVTLYCTYSVLFENDALTDCS